MVAGYKCTGPQELLSVSKLIGLVTIINCEREAVVAMHTLFRVAGIM